MGAPAHTVNSNTNQGAAYVFAGSGGTWSQQAELTASDGAASDQFGIAAAIGGSTDVVGARYHEVGGNGDEGATYLFVPTTTATLTPGSLSFGNVAIDATSAAKMVTLKNTGTAPLEIGPISIAPSGNFTISNTTCGSTLAVNKTCKLSVTFTTTQLGAASATLSLSSNATSSPQTVALSATGVPQTTLTPAAISFATTKVGSTSTQMVTLKNNLPTALTGISYSITPPFGIAAASTCGTTLNRKASCVFKVTFSPSASGSATGTLTVSDSANNSPLTVSIEGDGD
ncbi:MAG: choice-of-anchor D domain-containing protein [Terriglobales bacterium]